MSVYLRLYNVKDQDLSIGVNRKMHNIQCNKGCTDLELRPGP
jgi:hypothetical protein